MNAPLVSHDETATSTVTATAELPQRLVLAAVLGGLVGVLGGMIGLGGAEFRLPILVAVFGFAALAAVIMNKALSLIVVIAALPARLVAVPLPEVISEWPVVGNLLAGTLIGAWLGAGWARKAAPALLYRVLAILLVLIAGLLAWSHLGSVQPIGITGPAQVVAGVATGVGIGVVAALMGVAGGELLIPAIVLLFAIDIKLAGSLSLLISLPTMLVAFARYSRDQAFGVLRDQRRFVLAMALGSIVGVIVGGMLLGAVPAVVLVPLLAALLLFSAVKVWHHA